MKLWVGILCPLMLLISCVPSSSTKNAVPTPSTAPSVVSAASTAPVPSATVVPTETTTPLPIYSMKVVTYNILYGAGIDRQFDKNLKAQGQFARYGRNRLPDLITLIKEWQPDILGLQEGAGWDRGDPSVIQQVATELKMNYFLARQQAGELSVMLLSKYKILDAQNLSAQIYPGGALRATLEGPDGLPLNVIVVHLDPNSADRRARQIDWLAEYLPAYLQQKTFLMGDFNQGFYFTRDGWEDGKLKDIGMELVAYAFVDNVLCNLGPEWQTTQWFQHYFPPSGISDHQPVGIEFVLYP